MRAVLVCLALFACSEPTRAQSYPEIRAKLDEQRRVLAAELADDRPRTLRRARALVVATLANEILPAWNGTAWAMGGVSQTPGEGEIACGYFVSTTLLHAGLQVERARMGQQASTYISRSLVPYATMWRTSDQPIDDFVDRLVKGGHGIYIVGLDKHVGFVIVDGDGAWFHHSGPGDGVRREPARTASFLSTSRYREVAKLFDDALLEKWLRGTPIPTVLPKR